MATEPVITSRYRDFPMASPLAASAQAWLTDPGTPAVPAKASATVMLLRPGEGGLEVFVIRRASSMVFAPNNLAFPGGGVDRADSATLRWAGPSPQEWAQALGQPLPLAQELVIAAAREVFEEAGVLLAGRDADQVVSAQDLRATDTEAARQALIDRELGFAQFLAEHDLVLRTDLMRPRAWWTTPECEPRRYNTWFFAAALPAGQQADGWTSEASHAAWVRPDSAIADHDAGREIMLPPTRVMLEQLSGYSGVDQVLASSVPVRQVQPWPTEHSGRVWMRAPLGPDGHGLEPPDSTRDDISRRDIDQRDNLRVEGSR